jgi:leukotriene-A4 hydrolase
MTYDARVTVPRWATAVMSALSKENGVESDGDDRGDRMFEFSQPVPIPSYLCALAVGELGSIDVSPRCRVWSEPSMVEAVAYEFSQVEDFLAAAERVTAVPYQWGRYDLLCLPPSFPYGGMENPCLTFVTPTLLAGDKSLADVVAHEAAHSWSGEWFR